MRQAYGQAYDYAKHLPDRPPFLITCDIGTAFHFWDRFTGGVYAPYGSRRTITMANLAEPDNLNFLRKVFEDPQSLDRSRERARITRAAASELGKLSAGLSGRFDRADVANFLMRCVFSFFAEDIGFLPPNSSKKPS